MPCDGQKEHDTLGFVEAIEMKMRPSVEQILDQLEPPVTAIVGDANVVWPADVAKERNIPVALLWTMSASCFELYRQLDILDTRPHRRLTAHLLGNVPYISLDSLSIFRISSAIYYLIYL